MWVCHALYLNVDLFFITATNVECNERSDMLANLICVFIRVSHESSISLMMVFAILRNRSADYYLNTMSHFTTFKI